ncbi:MAG: hypothetical protein GC180_03340 [Bacteroidetes bacterium]|nr:hypothetical protein [Bacteroidota bacterium]
MNINNHTVIFEWMESRPFAQLNSEEQAAVLKAMDALTYDEMYLAICIIEGRNPEVKTRGKEAIWEKIATSFPTNKPNPVAEPDEVTNKKKTTALSLWLNRNVPASRVAALLILLMLAFAWLFFYHTETQFTEVPVIQKDTVYVDRAVPTEVPVHDTVWLQSHEKVVRTVAIKKPARQNVAPSLEPELHVQSASESSDPINNPKRNSLQFDTLVSKIGFVTL